MSPGGQGKCSYNSCWCAARSADVSAARSADESDPGIARLHGSGLLAPWHRMATVAGSMPASVYSRVARKRKFSTLSHHSAVENGSFLYVTYYRSDKRSVSVSVKFLLGVCMCVHV